MKKIFLILFCVTFRLSAQTLNDQLFEEGAELYNAGNYNKAHEKFKAIIQTQNDYYSAWMGLGMCQMMFGEYSLAETSLTYAYWMENSDQQSLHGLVFLEVLKGGDKAYTKRVLKLAVRLYETQEDLDAFIKDCKDISEKKNLPEIVELIPVAEEYFKEMNYGKDTKAVSDLFFKGLDKLEAADYDGAKADFDKVAYTMNTSNPPFIDNLAQTYHTMGYFMEVYGMWEYALSYYEQGYDYYQNNKVNNPYGFTLILSKLAEYYNAFGETNKVLAITGKHFQDISANPVTHTLGQFMVQRLNAQSTKYTNTFEPADQQDFIEEAKVLLELSGQMKRDAKRYKSNAYSFLMQAHVSSSSDADRRLAMQYGEKAKEIALETGIEELINNTGANLAISYFQNGYHDKARNVSKEVANAQMSTGNYSGANITYTNLGAMYLYDKQFSSAIENFKIAIELVEQQREFIPIESRMQYQSVESSSYAFLNQALAKTNNSRELYASLERSRGRVLAERLSEEKRSDPGIEWVQNQLKADEALLMFGITEPGAVAVCIVKKNSIKSVYHEDLNFNKNLQRHFANAYKVSLNLQKEEKRGYFNPFEADGLDKIGEVTGVLRELLQDGKSTTGIAANVKTDMLKAFYNFLLKDAEPYLVGVKNLIVCPDSYLGFIPFEALVTTDNYYLIQKYGVRYIPSVTIWKAMQERNYSDGRKNMLAFGGATYYPYTKEAQLAYDLYGFQNLLLEVDKKLKNNQSLRQEYAALGVTGKSWNYLPGTLTEVSEIAKKVEGVEVYTAADFSESRIKKMSASGALNDYRVVHLATHGMVVPTLPEMSTVITTLSATESGGEDGYLNQVEISKLKLQADFVALSACETGLGKVFAGEGISGLMQSLILAGANGMSVSLWAVSDQGTMYFMTGLYDLVFNKGYSYSDAMDTMKRKFIKGDYGELFRHPNYWAPYVYYGK